MKYNLYKNYSNTFVFDTKISGPTIAIFGGIHGNEVAGIQVIDRLKKDLEKGEIQLLKGKLILAYGNEEAIKINEREFKYNLNRIFKEEYFNSDSQDYEIKRVKELKDILDNSDVLLDIHSVSSESEAFMFSENISKELEIAKKISQKNIIIGWGEIGGDLLGGDTDGYMHSLGKTAFTFESGNHLDSDAFYNGFLSAKVLLEYFGLLEKSTFIEKNNNQKILKMYKIAITETGNFKFEKNIKNFDFIKKGVLIGYDGKQKVFAKEDFYILLPNFGKTKIGEDIFYYGKKLD